MKANKACACDPAGLVQCPNPGFPLNRQEKVQTVFSEEGRGVPKYNVSCSRAECTKIASSFRYGMKFSIENGFFIPGPSLAAEKQGLGLKIACVGEPKPSYAPKISLRGPPPTPCNSPAGPPKPPQKRKLTAQKPLPERSPRAPSWWWDLWGTSFGSIHFFDSHLFFVS